MQFRPSTLPVVFPAALSAMLLAAAFSAHAQSRFTVSADGQEVADTQMKLIWQRCVVGMKWDGKTCTGKATKMTLVQAKKTQDASNPGWRTPNKDELTSLVDKAQKKSKIDSATFPATPAGVFWALRPETSDNLNAWLVDFRNGKVFGNTRKASYMVRLVRTAA